MNKVENLAQITIRLVNSNIQLIVISGSVLWVISICIEPSLILVPWWITKLILEILMLIPSTIAHCVVMTFKLLLKPFELMELICHVIVNCLSLIVGLLSSIVTLMLLTVENTFKLAFLLLETAVKIIYSPVEMLKLLLQTIVFVITESVGMIKLIIQTTA